MAEFDPVEARRQWLRARGYLLLGKVWRCGDDRIPSDWVDRMDEKTWEYSTLLITLPERHPELRVCREILDG